MVTGASTGIGKAIALALDAVGFRLFAGVRSEADGAALRREATGTLTPLFLDVTDESSIARAVEMMTGQINGELYGLVNNAGVGLGGPLELVPISETRKLMEVNVIGLLAVTQAFVPLLRKARGRIVNMGSLAGIIAIPGGSGYAASKFAVQAITDSLRVEFAPFGIQVTIVIQISQGYAGTAVRAQTSKGIAEDTGPVVEPNLIGIIGKIGRKGIKITIPIQIA